MTLKRTLEVTFISSWLAVGAGASPTGPLAVSPGSAAGSIIPEPCPTFNWAAVEGAESYEIVVYKAEPASEDTTLVLRKHFPGTVYGWTPSLDLCLEPGAQYAWAVRAIGPEVPSDWSEPSLFQVRSGPSASELERAIEVVLRHVRGREDAPPAVLAEANEDLLAGIEEPLAPRSPPPPETKLRVDGTIEALSYTGSGESLTNLDPTNLSAGTADIDISGAAGTAAPSGAAGGDLTGAYPSPTVVDSLARDTEVAAAVAAHGAIAYGHHAAPNLSFDGSTLSISDGNGVDLSSLQTPDLFVNTSGDSMTGNLEFDDPLEGLIFTPNGESGDSGLRGAGENLEIWEPETGDVWATFDDGVGFVTSSSLPNIQAYGDLVAGDDVIVNDAVTLSALSGEASFLTRVDGSGVLGKGPGAIVAHNLTWSSDDITLATELVLGDDECTGSLSLPFTFHGFGTSTSSVRLSSNGVLFFGTECSTDYINTDLPASVAEVPMLFFFWDDLKDFGSGQFLRYGESGEAPQRSFQIDYRMRLQDTGVCGTDNLRVKIQISETSNLVTVVYEELAACGALQGAGATIGLQTAGGADSTAYPVSKNRAILDDDAAGSIFLSFQPVDS